MKFLDSYQAEYPSLVCCLVANPTRERLCTRGILVPSIMCLVCSSVMETIDHLFFGVRDVDGSLASDCCLVGCSVSYAS